MSELVHVQLGGPMARHFGRHWHLKVRNTKQALDLVEANRPLKSLDETQHEDLRQLPHPDHQ